MVQTDFVCGAHLFTISVTFAKILKMGNMWERDKERRTGISEY